MKTNNKLNAQALIYQRITMIKQIDVTTLVEFEPN